LNLTTIPVLRDCYNRCAKNATIKPNTTSIVTPRRLAIKNPNPNRNPSP
jgi:hypothetical protein